MKFANYLTYYFERLNTYFINGICYLVQFELKKWLEEYNPSKQEVKKLVEYLSQAFIACGTNPKDLYATVFKVHTSNVKLLELFNDSCKFLEWVSITHIVNE